MTKIIKKNYYSNKIFNNITLFKISYKIFFYKY